jgi:phage shock protein C
MFCPSCGNESAPSSIACTYCSALIVSNDLPLQQFRIVRPTRTRTIGGVCAGIAIHYGWDIYRVRMAAAIAACLTTGGIIPIYLLAWKFFPNAAFAMPPATRMVCIRPVDRSTAA